MRIAHVKIRNYRCHKELDLAIDNLGILIGSNGAGKSAALYALQWFFDGGELEDEDRHESHSANVEEGTTIEVEVHFVDLDDDDRAVLGKYARRDTAIFRRSWSRQDGEKIIGNSRQGTGFSAVRSATKASDKRIAYKDAQAQVPELPNWTNVANAESAMDAWESESSNSSRLVDIDDANASHLFGFTGSAYLGQRFRMILVPAAADLASQVGSTNKGTVLSDIVGSAIASALRTATNNWQEENKEQLDQLHDSVRETMGHATRGHEQLINDYLTQYVTDARLRLIGVLDAPQLRPSASVNVEVTTNGQSFGVERQGHGVQRAVMMAAIQSMARSGELTESADDEAQSLSAPAVLLAIEEPEIYQHPVRARHFAQVLREVSSRPSIQVLIATHSPYFVLPEQLEGVRRFTNDGVSTEVLGISLQNIAERIAARGSHSSDRELERVRKFTHKELPGEFSEGLFSDAVVLVEGDTDRAVFQGLAELMQISLDARGVSVISVGGKGGLEIPYHILRLLQIPCHLVFDGDLDTSGNDGVTTTGVVANSSHATPSDGLPKWLSYEFASALRDGQCSEADQYSTDVVPWTMLPKNLEAELRSWPSFQAEHARLPSGKGEKNALAYRNCVLAADVDDAPTLLQQLIKRIADLPTR